MNSASYVRAVRTSQEEIKKSILDESIRIYHLEEFKKSILGEPISIDHLLVAQNNFPEPMKWDDAIEACEEFGEDWRLPTMWELDILYKNRRKIGLLEGEQLWSSNLKEDIRAYVKDFNNGYLTLKEVWLPSNFRVVKIAPKEEIKENIKENLIKIAPKEEIKKSIKGSVIGKPIRLQNFEVAQYDFEEEMTWEKAKAECYRLGKGWRLPTKNELNVMYKNKDRIGGFADDYYWSSTEYGSSHAWGQNVNAGYQLNYLKNVASYVRAIRAF